LLSKLSGQEDIIVGTATAGRRHADLERIVGMFVNTLAMRNYPEGEKNVAEYLKEVKNATLNAFDNQEYQFENLVDRLSVRRDTGRNPLFDVMFNLLNQTEYKKRDKTPPSTPSTRSTTSTMPVTPLETRSKVNNNHHPNEMEKTVTSKFDLSLSVIETVDTEYIGPPGTANAVESMNTITIQFEYSTSLFNEETIKKYITYFKTIMQNVTREPYKKIGEIEIITREEKNRILYEFNDTAAGYPTDETIH
ncbi:MAG: hypothetical protein GY757_50600, partial [bacterium]|nr:hypothetical protein [bacterium]